MPFSSERTMGFPIKPKSLLLKTEEGRDLGFEKVSEGQNPRSALGLELRRFSFIPETQKTVLKEEEQEAIVVS